MNNYTHHHSKIGVTKLVISKRTKNYIVKVKYGEVIVTAPTLYSIDAIDSLLDKHTEEILEALSQQGDFNFREGFCFESEAANIVIARSTLTKPYIKIEEKNLTIFLSRSQDELTDSSQNLLTKIVENHLKTLGTDRIFTRLKYWADQMGIKFKRFKLGKAKSTWGKCDSMRNIVISVYATLLPEHLLDYLLIHELAHISEMNHGDNFWRLVDQFTNNRAKALSEELKGYNTSIVQFKKP